MAPLTYKLLDALRAKDYTTASDVFKRVMREKVNVQMQQVQRNLLGEAEEPHCDVCGSTKNVTRVGDGYVCKECDVEENVEAEPTHLTDIGAGEKPPAEGQMKTEAKK